MPIKNDLQEGANVGENWRDINDVKREVRFLASQVQRLTAAVEDLRQKRKIKRSAAEGSATWV